MKQDPYMLMCLRSLSFDALLMGVTGMAAAQTPSNVLRPGDVRTDSEREGGGGIDRSLVGNSLA